MVSVISVPDPCGDPAHYSTDQMFSECKNHGRLICSSRAISRALVSAASGAYLRNCYFGLRTDTGDPLFAGLRRRVETGGVGTDRAGVRVVGAERASGDSQGSLDVGTRGGEVAHRLEQSAQGVAQHRRATPGALCSTGLLWITVQLGRSIQRIAQCASANHEWTGSF